MVWRGFHLIVVLNFIKIVKNNLFRTKFESQKALRKIMSKTKIVEKIYVQSKTKQRCMVLEHRTRTELERNMGLEQNMERNWNGTWNLGLVIYEFN